MYAKRLPPDSQGDRPDDDSPTAVQNHPSSGTDLLRHTYTREVEESYTDNIPYNKTQLSIVYAYILIPIKRFCTKNTILNLKF